MTDVNTWLTSRLPMQAADFQFLLSRSSTKDSLSIEAKDVDLVISGTYCDQIHSRAVCQLTTIHRLN